MTCIVLISMCSLDPVYLRCHIMVKTVVWIKIKIKKIMVFYSNHSLRVQATQIALSDLQSAIRSYQSHEILENLSRMSILRSQN
jgi:hypothetical protein